MYYTFCKNIPAFKRQFTTWISVAIMSNGKEKTKLNKNKNKIKNKQTNKQKNKMKTEFLALSELEL